MSLSVFIDISGFFFFLKVLKLSPWQPKLPSQCHLFIEAELFKSHTACERYLHWLISPVCQSKKKNQIIESEKWKRWAHMINILFRLTSAVRQPGDGGRCSDTRLLRWTEMQNADKLLHWVTDIASEGLAHTRTTVTCIKKMDYKAMKGDDRTWANMSGTSSGTNKQVAHILYFRIVDSRADFWFHVYNFQIEGEADSLQSICCFCFCR